MNWNKFPDFSEKEFVCKCCNNCNISKHLIEKLQLARDLTRKFTNTKEGIPFRIESGCRCKKHNAEIGGAKNSSHLFDKNRECTAVDLSCKNSQERFYVIRSLIAAGFKRIGLYNKHNGIHADVDESKKQNLIWKL